MTLHNSNRRQFLHTTVGATAAAGSMTFLSRLPQVRAQDAQVNGKVVRFDEHLEPLVRLIEESPRENLLEQVADRIRQGRSYREVLAALFLASVRNVQPRPSVGFKFHCVLVINSCHQASLCGPDEDRWLPIFWALDYFKSSQADEKRRSGWRMKPVNESLVPDAQHARAMFVEAMDKWDVEKADAATAGLVRLVGATEVFNLFARYAARDYRSIGHKAIYLANAWRTLQVIGWEFAEPVLRSLCFALLNHSSEPNPAESDLDADRPWRQHVAKLDKIPTGWLSGKLDSSVPNKLFEVFRTESPEVAADLAVDSLVHGVAPQSIWDGVFVGAGELLMRQPGIIGLHGLTTANAMHYIWQNTADEKLRQQLLLQACSFNTMFRDSAKRRGKLGSRTIDALDAKTLESGDGDQQEILGELLTEISNNRTRAAEKLHGYLRNGGDGRQFVDAARRVLFAKGRDAHDYKFTSAVLEDYMHVSEAWRDRFLATSVFNLKGLGHQDNQLAARSRAALEE